MSSSATWRIHGAKGSLHALHQELRGFFYKRVHSWDLADDLTQQTWLAGEHFQARSSRRFYLFTVARNVLVSLYRRRARDEQFCQVDTELDELIFHATSLDTKVDTAAENARLRALLAELPESFQTVVRLKAAGYTGEEIGEMLGISPNTVRSRLSRARTRLRELLAEQGE